MLGENLLICLTTLAAARHSGVERILYARTITVYPHMEVCREEFDWSGNPHPAKDMGRGPSASPRSTWKRRNSNTACRTPRSSAR